MHYAGIKIAAARSGRPNRCSTFAAGLLLACCSLGAVAADADKEDAIVSDRPDFAESSVVVGRGRVQFETSVAWERSKNAGITEKTWTTPSLLRIGMGDTLELRVESDGRARFSTDDTDVPVAQRTVNGWSDASVGVKWHAYDEEDYSMGFLLHVDLDSGSSQFRGNGVRPSFRMANEWELPNDFGLSIMPGVIWDKNAAGNRFVSGVLAISLDKGWNDRTHTFVEIASPQIASGKNGGTQLFVDTGVTYLLSKNMQIDTAITRGLNNKTADWGWTVGFSIRM